jgi:N-acetylglucosamine-6-phosphate deacetylase
MRLRARHYATGQPIDVLCQNGRIAGIEPGTEVAPDFQGGYIAPALFDLQINGAAGHGFSSDRLTEDDIRQVIAACRQHGIGAFCPTLVTNSHAALVHGFTTLRRACEVDPAIARALPCFHLEGPYLSPEDGPRGAHARQHIRPPDRDEFQRLQEAAGGRIRLVTLAPETPGALDFIDFLCRSGVVVALGHTAATGACIRAAIAAGARLSTHLGNGSHALLPRHDNYLWEQLAADELWASLICDGEHLPPAVMRCLLRVKTPARAILTCDASSLAGLPPGRYQAWDMELEVLPSGRIVVPGTPYLAGSGVLTDACLGPAIQHGGVRLAEALDMAGARPRQLLGLPALTLESGAPADLVLFDWQPGQSVRVTGTVIAGDWVYRVT